MTRWYQHVFTGKQVEVKTLEEDDQYVGVSVWARIAAPSPDTVTEPEAPKPVKQTAKKKT